MKPISGISLLILFVFLLMTPVFLTSQDLEQRVTELEEEVDSMASTGLVLFLFGSFCALWAQNMKRNPWGWFFFGLFLGPIAAVFVLIRNSELQKSG